MKLSEQAITAITKNGKLRNRLAYELDCHPDTLSRYLKNNDVMLTTASALKAITEETGLTQEEILTEETHA